MTSKGPFQPKEFNDSLKCFYGVDGAKPTQIPVLFMVQISQRGRGCLPVVVLLFKKDKLRSGVTTNTTLSSPFSCYCMQRLFREGVQMK